ncbi:MAG: TonB-dependent receptor plug domain-containing protein, partial [Planctomycetota bacterium]
MTQSEPVPQLLRPRSVTFSGQEFTMRLATVLLLCAAAARAQEAAGKAAGQADIDRAVEDYLSAGELPDVQVTATRVARDPFDTPRSITLVTPEEYRKRRPSVALDVLDQHPGLWVEKRTATTSDPVLRGFSGANLLALIDGNTLTTLWGEGGFAGDDMYGKLDAYLVDRVEVVRGPTSVLYGSNNLGGVIHFLTRSSRFDYTKEGIVWGGTLFADFSSVDVGVRGRIEHHGASPRWRWLIGLSAADIGDVRGGGDVGIQEPTSGEDRFYDAKVQYRLSESEELEVFLQDS